MTIQRKFEKLHKILKYTDLSPGHSEMFLSGFKIYCYHHDDEYMILFSEKNNKWRLKKINFQGNNENLFSSDNIDDFLINFFEILNDKNGLDIFKLNQEIIKREKSKMKLEEALESLNQ